MTKQEAPKQLGRYQIIRELGKGNMGIVYEGFDPSIGRRVAIKTAKKEILEDDKFGDEMMQRFLREARAAGILNHPNIVTIYDVGEEQGVAYIAMEYLEGTELRKLLQEKRAFSPEEAVEIVKAVCLALDHAHAHGIVHRDVKPANVMFTKEGIIKVTDFGIARVSDSELTREGSLIGTPYYMSPEQFMGRKVDGRSDLFAAGVICYELLTGEKPFPGESVGTVMHNVLKRDPVPPRELNMAIPEALEQVVLKALNKDPRKRYQTGKLMASALVESLKYNPSPEILGLNEEKADISEAPTVVRDKTTYALDVVSTTAELPKRPRVKSASSGIETISSAHITILAKNKKTKLFLWTSGLILGFIAITLVLMIFFGKKDSLNQVLTSPCWAAVEFEILEHQFGGLGAEVVNVVTTPTIVEIYGRISEDKEEKIITATLEHGNTRIDFPQGKWPRRFRYIAKNSNYVGSAEGESVREPSKIGDIYVKMPIHFYK